MSTSETRSTQRTGHVARVFLCSVIVCLVWGSSYLATSIGVHSLPPRLFSGIRFTLGGLLLLTVARLRGRRPVLRGAELRHTLVMSVCSIVLSNGFNNWAMQWVPSNQAALLNTSSSLFIAGFGTFGPRAHPITRTVALGLVMGFLGVTLILWPGAQLQTGHILPQIAILLGCLGWAFGTVYFRSVGTRLDILSFTGAQMLFGGLMLTALGVGFGELRSWSWSPRGLALMAYLTLFSSCFAYLAYAWLARNATPAQTGIFGYVNPAVATVLGWLVLDERLTVPQLLGMCVILGGVVLVTASGSFRGRDARSAPRVRAVRSATSRASP
jgi:drug/metabolite transporter (DMT)-like permease